MRLKLMNQNYPLRGNQGLYKPYPKIISDFTSVYDFVN